MHRSSAHIVRQWELSAKRSLHRKFDEVASLYQVMRENERQHLEQKNLQAVRDWSGGSTSTGLPEHIQILAGPLHELTSTVDPGGRFRRHGDDFHRWITWVEEIWSAREGDVAREGSGLKSAESLGDSWKAENAALTRKFTTFSRDLDRLTQPAPGSSLASIVATCKQLLTGLLDELQTMVVIEAGIATREKEWVETQLKAIAQDIGAHLQTNGDVEAWRI